MTFQEMAPIVVALIAATGALIQSRNRRPRTREAVKQDAELLGLLPENSKGRRLLQDHIDARIAKIIEDEDLRTRDGWNFFGGISLLALGSLGVLIFIDAPNDAWWGWVCLAIGVPTQIYAGMWIADALIPRRRNAGRPR